MATTLVAGVIVAGVGSNANPHNLREHIDVAISSPSDGDVIKYVSSTGLWTKSSPLALPVADHNHSGVYATPSDLTLLAPKASPSLTGTVSLSSDAPTIQFVETDGSFGQWNNSIRMNDGAIFFKVDSEDVKKIEGRYVEYGGLSLGLPFSAVSADAIARNPSCVYYVNATNNNVTLSLQAVVNYYRTLGRLSGVVLIFVREDSSANTVTIIANGTDTIDGSASITLSGQKSYVMLQATDTGWKKILFSSGSSQDSGWTDMQFYHAFASDSRGSPLGTTGMVKFQARKVVNTVYLRGGMYFSSSVSANNNIFRLPVGMYPSVPTTVNVFYTLVAPSFTANALLIKTDGFVSVGVPATPAAATLYIDTVSFLIT